MQTIISIDPGKDGGIAVRFPEYTEAYPMPDTFGDIIDLFRSIYAPSGNIVCYMEKYRMTHLEASRAYKRDWMRRQRAAFHAAGLTSNGQQRKV